MPNNEMFKNIQKVLNLLNELRGMSVEVLKDICMQYGDDYSSDVKEELINTIMGEELSKQELEDYQKYLRYYYFTMFREQMTGLSQLDGYITDIEELYRKKNDYVQERGRALDRKRSVELRLSDALPLVRLNIEYSHVERSYNDFIKMMTKTGMKLASITETKEEIQRKGPIYRFLKKGTLADLTDEEVSFRQQRNHDLDEAYDGYLAVVKVYGEYLKEAFFKMLDNMDIAESVYLYTQLSMDFDSESAFKPGYASNHRFTEEEKEEIFNNFIQSANFDPEQNLTGEEFYEAVKKFVTKYYDVMESRLSLKQNQCNGAIREIVGKQRTVVDGMKKNQEELDIFTPEEQSTLSLIYQENGTRKK